MDLTNMIPGGAGEEKTPQQQLSKEEYAAMKKQQREEVWAEVDAQAQAVFQNGDSLKGFLDFMAQCNTQKTPNLLLINVGAYAVIKAAGAIRRKHPTFCSSTDRIQRQRW